MNMQIYIIYLSINLLIYLEIQANPNSPNALNLKDAFMKYKETDLSKKPRKFVPTFHLISMLLLLVLLTKVKIHKTYGKQLNNIFLNMFKCKI